LYRFLTTNVDVWSVGCIFAELLGRKPLFQGKDYIHQITKISDILGTPPEDEIENIRSEPARRYIRQMGYKQRIPFAKLYPQALPEAIDLLDRMLAFDPGKRCTVDEALRHPYLASLHDPEEEPTCAAIFNFDFEHYELNKETFQELIWQEMLAFHPECAIMQ